MSAPYTFFPTLQSPNWKLTRSSQWKTQVKTASSGNRKRNPLQAHTLWKWTLKNGVLQSDPAIGDLQAIEDLFVAMYGRLGYFLWQDPEPTSLANPTIQAVVCGTYYWPVAFTHDSVDFDRFAYQLWTCGTLEFEQVYPPPFVRAPCPIIAATLTVWSSYTNLVPAVPAAAGIAAQPFADAAPFGQFGAQQIVNTTGDYALQANTYVFPALGGIDDLNSTLSFTMSSFISNPSHAVGTGNAVLKLYDCVLEVTYKDLTTEQFRPSRYRIVEDQLGHPGFGNVTDPKFAFDVDTAPPATAATLTRTDFDLLNFVNAFELKFDLLTRWGAGP